MTLKEQLKEIIAETLNLIDVSPQDIKDDTLLFGGDLGLDSIDAIEIVFQVKKHFNVEIRDMNEGRPALQTINTLAAFIEKRGWVP